MNRGKRPRRPGYKRGPYRATAWRRRDKPTPLAAARIARGLTQEQAAIELGINRTQLAGYESGMRRITFGPVGRKLRAFIEENREPENAKS